MPAGVTAAAAAMNKPRTNGITLVALADLSTMNPIVIAPTIPPIPHTHSNAVGRVIPAVACRIGAM